MNGINVSAKTYRHYVGRKWVPVAGAGEEIEVGNREGWSIRRAGVEGAKGRRIGIYSCSVQYVDKRFALEGLFYKCNCFRRQLIQRAFAVRRAWRRFHPPHELIRRKYRCHADASVMPSRWQNVAPWLEAVADPPIHQCRSVLHSNFWCHLSIMKWTHYCKALPCCAYLYQENADVAQMEGTQKAYISPDPPTEFT